MRPSLSVILPNYNHAEFLPTALEAILSQSRPADEVIIIDDASTDDSISVIESFVRRHSSIRYLQQKHNQGPNAAVNRGLAAASGEYAAFCSADDRVLPSFFETGMNLLEKYPQTGLFCSQMCFFDTNAPEILLEKAKSDLTLRAPRAFSPAETLRLLRTTNFRIYTPSAILKRSSILAAGGYRTQAKMLSDWILNYQIALHEGFVYAPALLASIRIRTKSINYSARLSQDRKMREEAYENVMQCIRCEPSRKIYARSLILYQLGINILFFLGKRPRYFSYIPSLIFKKFRLLAKALFR